MANSPLMVYVTCPDKDLAGRIAHELVEQHCAACVNIVPDLVSTYRWQGKVETDNEVLMLIKTTEQAYPRMQKLVVSLHPDDVPEIVAVPLNQGLAAYLQWVEQETRA